MALPQKPQGRRSRIWTAVALSVAVHLLVLPLVARDAIFKVPPRRQRTQVGMVSQTRQQLRGQRPNPNSTPSSGKAEPDLQPKLPKDQLAEVKPKEPEKISGQIVDLGQPKDERPPAEPTRYLSEKDSRVLKETRARETSAFFKNALSKIQKEGKNEKRAEPAPVAPQEPPPGLPEPGKQGGAAGKTAQQGPQITSRPRQDAVHLSPAPEGTVRNRRSSEATGGGGRYFALGQGPKDRKPPSPGRGDNALSGLPGGKGQPLKLTLDRPLDVLGPVSGGPMPDDLRGLEEGEETLLNSRSFKYAGYLNRVKETVGRIWTQRVQDESFRRDPTGQVYSYKDRRTVIEFTLDSRGDVRDVRISSSSGVPFLDEVAADSFRKAERFPNPPPGLIGSNGQVTMPFAFTLLAATGGLRIQAGPAYVPGAPAGRGY